MAKSTLQSGLAVGRVLTVLPAFVIQVWGAVAEAAGDGVISPEEGEVIARKLSADEPDLLTVRVRGVDVIDVESQADIAAAIGRTAARIVQVLRA